MDDTRAYIDLVFRNGLKDYEETPPPEVWEDVKFIIDKKIKRFMFFVRSAASIAVIVSISILANNMLRKETTKDNVAVINNNEPVMDIIIPIPPAIVQERTETIIVSNKFETVIAPVKLVADNLEISDIYTEDSNIDESESLVADIETLPENQETLNIDYDKIFAEYRSTFYNNIYDNAVNDEDSRWSILAMASPMYQSQFTTSSSDLSNQIMASEKGRASYSGGMGVAYKLNNRLSLQSGVYYSAIGQEVDGVIASSGFQQINIAKSTSNFKVLTRSGAITVTNPDIFVTSNEVPEVVVTRYTPGIFDPYKDDMKPISNSLLTDLRYLELPLMLRYKAIDRKMGVSLVGGLSYNFVVNSFMYAVADDGKHSISNKIEGVNNILSSSLGMGMEYKFSRSFSFNVEPTLKYYLNTSNSTGINTYSFGVFSGLSYKF